MYFDIHNIQRSQRRLYNRLFLLESTYQRFYIYIYCLFKHYAKQAFKNDLSTKNLNASLQR